MDNKINKYLELEVSGRPDRGLNYDLILKCFNEKPEDEQISFMNEFCNILDVVNTNKMREKITNVSELIFNFLNIPYEYEKGRIEVVAISRINNDTKIFDTYKVSLDDNKFIEKFGSTANKIIRENDELGDKVFEKLLNYNNTSIEKNNKFKI